MDGIQTAQGSYDLAGATQGQLGWSGVGQYNDLVNPCAMMVWMGAVANGGAVRTEYFEDYKLCEFEETKPLSTYLFAFAAGRFRFKELHGSSPLFLKLKPWPVTQ